MTNEPAGLLNVNKPQGVTSAWVVRQVKRALGSKKVGHCGTLDPMAEGVLLVVFGAATKMQLSLMKKTKSYRARMLLGVTTDTQDTTGRILDKREIGAITVSRISDVIKSFEGEIEQIPPMYSALKHKGKRLYELARAGFTVERKARRIKIHKIELIDFKNERIEIRVQCSSGTYIRTLCEDIGNALGCGATMEYLCREEITPFKLDSAVDVSRINSFNRLELLEKTIPIEQLNNILQVNE